MPFFTHGIELNHFSDVKITDFKGSASPLNKSAYRIYAVEGKKFITDDNEKEVLKNVQ